MSALDRNVKVTCRNSGTSVTKKHLSRQKSSCSGGILYCPKSPNLSTESQIDLNYHFARRHSAPKLDVTFKCELFYQGLQFPGFYALRQH